MESTGLDPRVFIDFEAAARDLEKPDGAEAWEALEAEFGFVAGPSEAGSTDDARALRLSDLLDALTAARSLVAEFGRDDSDTASARLADLERRIGELLVRVRDARARIHGPGRRSHP